MSNKPVAPELPYGVITDEASLYFGNQDDTLRQELRAIEGVPDRTYLVEDQNVFVFEKLVSLVKDNGDSVRVDGALNSSSVIELLTSCWMTPIEAVTDWGIVPVPFKVIKPEDSFTDVGFTLDYAVVHGPFNSLVPVRISSQSDVNETLAKLLVGEIVQSNGNFSYNGEIVQSSGDFNYEGQPYWLRSKFDLTALPLQPSLPRGAEEPLDQYVSNRLAKFGFSTGFEPVSSELYAAIVALESAWRVSTVSAKRFGIANFAMLKENISKPPFAILNDPSDENSDYLMDEAAELVSLYPELSTIKSSTLVSYYSRYQQDYRYMGSWSPSREMEFVYYVLGLLVDPELSAFEAIPAGEIAASLLAHGDDWDHVKNTTVEWLAFDSAVSDLVYRVNMAINFVKSAKETGVLQGAMVQTTQDLFNSMRSFGAKTTTAVQSVTDFVELKR